MASPNTSNGDKESIQPTEIGDNLGQIIYRSTNVQWQYSEWHDYDSGSPHAENPPHSGHGPFA
jgi:hypothetical protein